MKSIPSRILKCGLWAIIAWGCFHYSLAQPSTRGAEKDDLKEEEEAGVKFGVARLAELRTLDVSEVKKKEAEGLAEARGKFFYFGPEVDRERSVPRIGYWVYKGLFMEGDHYYQGKLIRADDLGLAFYLSKPNTGDIKAALTKKYGKPEPGPKFEWMKLKSLVDERCHWDIKATITQEGKPLEIKVACELNFRKDGDPIISLIDTERAESVGKALGGQPAAGGVGEPLDVGMPSYAAGPLRRIIRRAVRW